MSGPWSWRAWRQKEQDQQAVDVTIAIVENLRVLIKKGPVSEETSLKEVEEMCSSKPEWRVIENGNKAENQLTKDLDILKALS